ncbi:DNA polymerase III subunit beta [Helicobacter anseris]|uniref:Beta sliding clamp n=1 Tax=Helicobacter anseris TaxID=375926 RepID=A0A3D8J5K3_9HELI|nr:DNA polymerase III subunit beta [Helicobacter anseris]RDU72466.1 DNA polymerase III subunit beta [Helicobacter anseris]
MKFSVNKNSFENVLNHLQPFLDKKDSSQITSHIYFETFENKILLKATDYEIGLDTNIEIKKEIDGSATVNGKKILEIIKRLKDGDLTLETDSQNIHITQGRSKFKLPMFDTNEFPKNIKSQNQNKINIDTSNFIQSLKKIIPAIDSNNQKISLTGALLELKDYHFSFVATDTRRLALMRQDIQSIESFSIILPKKAINEIIKLFPDNMEIYYSDTQLTIQNEYYSFFTKLINDRFPDYEKIIPKEFKIQMKLPKDEIIDAIKLINSLSTKFRMTFKQGEILFETMSNDSSEQAQTQIEFSTGLQEEFSIGIDSRYMLDFLAHIETPEFEICINESNTPFIVKSGNFSTIILPVI